MLEIYVILCRIEFRMLKNKYIENVNMLAVSLIHQLYLFNEVTVHNNN